MQLQRKYPSSIIAPVLYHQSVSCLGTTPGCCTTGKTHVCFDLKHNAICSKLHTALSLARGLKHLLTGHFLLQQTKGLLNIAQPQKSKPLPSFEKWSFTEKRYIQYMCDQQNVHYALEAAIAEAVAIGPAGPHKASAVQPSKDCAAAFQAIACFGESAGLDR